MGLIDQMMANLYKPPKQEKPNTILPKNLTPAKMATLANQSAVVQGQILRGEVLDLRSHQILVLLENGATVSARTEGTLNLSIGQHANFFVAQTTEDQILLKLAKEDTPAENPMIDKALSAANIQKTARSVSIVTELLAHQQPVNEAGIRRYLSLSAKHPEVPVKDLILMELHHIPVTKENLEQFSAYQGRTAKLLTQTQHMLQHLADTVENLPDGPAKQEILRELQQVLKVSAPTAIQETEPKFTTAMQETASKLTTVMQETAPKTTTAVQENVPLSTANTTTVPGSATGSLPVVSQLPADIRTDIRIEPESFLQNFLHSFLLQPEDVADPDKVRQYYEELNETLTKLEQLSVKIAEDSVENAAATPKQIRQNLSFMEAVNHVFPYLQLPLKFKESPAHGELYVYEKKKALKPSDTLSALLHLELEALGTMDIYVTLAGTHVTTRFSMTDKESGNFIRTELPRLTEALAAKGYSLSSEVSVREPSEENTPTLLEQFLEELAPGGLNRYTFDIRA